MVALKRSIKEFDQVLAFLKQERRGGIETADREGGACGNGGSRNAVVALKLNNTEM